MELVEHTVSHADDDDIVSELESKVLQLDVGEFIDQYRVQRDLNPEPYV